MGHIRSSESIAHSSSKQIPYFYATRTFIAEFTRPRFVRIFIQIAPAPRPHNFIFNNVYVYFTMHGRDVIDRKRIIKEPRVCSSLYFDLRTSDHHSPLYFSIYPRISLFNSSIAILVTQYYCDYLVAIAVLLGEDTSTKRKIRKYIGFTLSMFKEIFNNSTRIVQKILSHIFSQNIFNQNG
jgi:hypothetical protein